MDQAPVIQEGRTLVPMRAIFEALNCNVEWISETKTVLAAKTGFDLSLTINQAEMLVNGQTYPLEVPGQIINERTMVPVRAISEALNAAVDWDADTKTVIINDNSSSPADSVVDKPHNIISHTESLEEKAEDGTLLGTLEYNYPEIVDTYGEAGVAIFNSQHQFDESCTNFFYTDLIVDAKALYAENELHYAGGQTVNYNITYDHNGIISVLKDDSIFRSNAAHPTTYRWGNTYDLATGEILGLTDILDLGIEQIYNMVVDGFNSQIAADPDSYLVDSISLNDMENMSYYLSKDGLVFYFQEYAIAPYASGFPEYVLPFKGHEELFMDKIKAVQQ